MREDNAILIRLERVASIIEKDSTNREIKERAKEIISLVNLLKGGNE